MFSSVIPVVVWVFLITKEKIVKQRELQSLKIYPWLPDIPMYTFVSFTKCQIYIEIIEKWDELCLNPIVLLLKQNCFAHIYLINCTIWFYFYLYENHHCILSEWCGKKWKGGICENIISNLKPKFEFHSS